jgi:hypothetical protein
MQQMLAMAFEPADQGVLEWLLDQGRQDARAWAEATGVAAAAAVKRQRSATPSSSLVLP